MRIATIVAVALFTTGGLAAAECAHAATTHYELNIPRQPLDAALKDLAQQTGLQVGRFSDAVKGDAVVGPVTGNYSADQALKTLLTPARLTYRTLNDRAIIVLRPEDVAQLPAAKTLTDNSARQSLSTLGESEDSPSSGEGREGQGGDDPSVEAHKKSFWSRLRLAQGGNKTDSSVSNSPSSNQQKSAISSKGSSEPAKLEEIVVTANKRVENAQDVALSVSVEKGKRLVERGLTSLADYAASVPGLNVASSGTPGQTAVSIRGISSNTSTSAVGAYIDDTPMGSSSGWANGSYTLLDMLPYDLDRLEVLRGPQGTLYGEGSMGGLIKYVLKTPSTNELQASVGADTSAIDGAGNVGYAFRSRVNMPVVPGVLGVSISAFGQRTPGYITNTFTGQRDTNQDRQYGGRLAALWTPTDNLSVKLTALTSVIEADDSAWRQFGDASSVPNAAGVLIVRPIDPLPDLTQSAAFPASYDQHLFYGSATLDWSPGSFDVVSATSWSRQRSFNENDETLLLGSLLPFLGGVAPGLVEATDSFGLNKLTQELRLVSPKGGRIEWLAGVFYTHEHAVNLQTSQAFDLHYQPTAPAFPPGLFYADFPSNFAEYAAFGNLTWNVTSDWSITAGGRYAYNDQNISFYTASGPSYPPPLPNYVDITTHQGVPTWMGAVQYHINRDTMAYARVATGYRPGGPNSPLPGVPNTYKADTLTNYELGLKSTFLDDKALLNLSIYRIDWKDIQLIAAAPDSPSFLANGGKAISQGVELESHYSPIRALTLGLSAAYTDAHLSSVIADASYLATGYQFPLVPKETVAVTTDYNFALAAGWAARVGGDYRYNGPTWQSLVETDSPLSTPTFRVPGYSVLDLNADVKRDHLTVKLYARNLTNNRALVGGGFGVLTNSATGARPIVGAFLQPRTLGVGFDYEF